jgi:hypothetical protein
MDVVEAKQRKDKIEQLDPDPTFDVGALQIMEELAETPTGLRWLVEHYSTSPSANIVGYLALVLAKRSAHSSDETAPLVFRFADELRCRDYEGALVSALGAMNNQIVFGAGWGTSNYPPYPLFRFVEDCLEFGASITCWCSTLLSIYSLPSASDAYFPLLLISLNSNGSGQK